MTAFECSLHLLVISLSPYGLATNRAYIFFIFSGFLSAQRRRAAFTISFLVRGFDLERAIIAASAAVIALPPYYPAIAYSRSDTATAAALFAAPLSGLSALHPRATDRLVEAVYRKDSTQPRSSDSRTVRIAAGCDRVSLFVHRTRCIRDLARDKQKL